MTLDRVVSIDDLERMARRRLPRIVYDMVASGTEDETCLVRNRAALAALCFLPRRLVATEPCDLSTSLLGETHAAPFGIAPTGFAGLVRPGAELMLAKAAAQAGIPFILSGANVVSIAQVAAAAPGRVWAHLYLSKDRTLSHAQIARADQAGVRTLVITADNPVPPKRERDMRNGFALPLRLRLPVLLEALRHPGWIVEYLRSGGLPTMQDWAPLAPAGARASDVAAFFRSQSPSVQTWEDLEAVRRRWPGRLLLKGIQHPDDAVRAIDAGVDGIIVSNHGGKVFDRLPSPVETLPAIKAVARGRAAVMFDGGIRRGSDIAAARCLGADFVFVGRATLYGVAAAGAAGAAKAIAILRDELTMTLAMIGCRRAAGLDASYLYSAQATP